MDQKATLKRTTEETKQKVLALYLEGKSQLQIEKTLKMTRKTIRTILKENDIHYKTKSEQWRIRYGNTLKEDVFETITPESAYWLGMLYTDGHIGSGNRGYNIEFGLHIQDQEHLKKYLKFLNSSNKIIEDSRGGYSRVRIGSEKLHRSLQNLGLNNRKSWDAIPHDSVKNSKDFWRGCVDGDGGIYKPYYKGGSKQLSLCGTKETIEGFIVFCKENVTIYNNKLPTRHGGQCLYEVSYYGKEAEAIATLLYKDSTTHLDRKYQIWKDWNLESPI